MATSGNWFCAATHRRNRRVAAQNGPIARIAPVATLVALLGVTSCTHSAQPTTTGTPSPSTGSPARPGVPAAGFCRTALPESWQTQLSRGRLHQQAGETLTVHAVGRNGHSVVADARTAGSRSVVLLDDGVRRTVLRLHRPDTDQLLGADYDGRHLVFSITHDPANLSDWTLYSWDSHRGGPPRVLARSATGSDGRPVDSPMLFPVTADGYAAWTSGTAKGTTRLHRYALATGTDHVVRAGHPGAPFLLGDDLVWPESPTPDTLTVLHAVAMRTGRPVRLPAPIADVRGPAFVDGGGGADRHTTLVWAGSGLRTLWVWRSGWSHRVRVVSVPEGRNIQWVRVAHDLVTWDDGTAQFAADLRSGAYTQLTSAYGYTEARGEGLAVGYPPTDKHSSAAPPTLVRVDRLPPLPGCA